jgi:anthraniloyl-CoA monooxygenase
VQFNYSLLTRSQRISHENLRLRDADWLESRRRLVPDAGRVAPSNAPVRAADVRAVSNCARWT